jgi:putative ABC transport system ATP-binding protein
MSPVDSQTGRQILRLLRTVIHSEGITALIATHDPVLIDIADSALRLDDGVLTAL